MTPAKSFHNIVDEKARRYQKYNGKNWIAGNPYTTYSIKDVTYQFFTHFHPYVANLIQNLDDGGIAELQAADTIYQPDTPTAPVSGNPILVRPNTSRAILLTAAAVTLSDGSTINLTAGTPLTVADGINIILPNPTTVVFTDGSTGSVTTTPTVQLPGKIPASSPSGIQWTIAAKDTVVPDGTPVTLAAASTLTLTYDGTEVTIPAGTSIAIRSGLPMPYLFEDFFAAAYSPDPSVVVQPYPVKELDFAVNGAYAIYNYEIFFHVPLLIAVHLSQNQQFQDAQDWFHYIFNPTDNSDGPTPQRFWRVQPFQQTDAESIEEILVNLSTNADPVLHDQTVASIQQWKNTPFQPWAVAKFRPTAYMLKTVMAYLDNLIAWGDSLFQQYTIETINEATQLYVLAANILGPKPQPVPKKGTVNTLTYAELRGNLNDFSETLADIETDIPFDLTTLPSPGVNPPGTQILPSIGQALYFCIPQNSNLLAYWDTVATRLFNIHNSLNLQGIFQILPLYDPPIDPALLVRATAEGLDVSAIVSGLNQPLPLVRFRYLISKAMEICGFVQSLGSALLSAIEKQDNESLAMLRSQNESTLLGLQQMIKYSQWQEAIKAKQAIEQTMNNSVQRYTYYQQLLGRKTADIAKTIPKLTDLDVTGLDQFNFSQADETGEPVWTFDPVNIDISSSAPVSDGNIKTLSGHEVQELNLIKGAEIANGIASGLSAVAAVLSAIPQFDADGEPLGVGVTVGEGGIQVSAVINALADVSRGAAEICNSEATQTSKAGSYERRTQDWVNQSNSARGEMNLVFRQLRGAQIQEAVASQEYQNHLVQMQQSKDIVTFLEGQALAGYPVKETTVDFYSWMKRETKTLYNNAFQLGFEVAKKAERALQNELGNPGLSYVQYNYLDGTEGLLAGDKLMFDLKTMEMAFTDLNQREYELTKHVSLLQVAPLALLQLRSTGSCMVNIPEELFDLDCPGHYFRRIKSVAITVPCVTGPYTSVNCTLTLQKSTIRMNSDVASGYVRKGANDLRFDDYFGALQTVVTSSAQSDSGLFETNLNDDRYLPFEAIGVAGSQWQLSLPIDLPQFDYDTITDVILHIRYTARDGGQAMKTAAVANLEATIKNAKMAGSVRLFSMRHEFPSEWAKFKAAAASPYPLSFTLLAQHYPYWSRALTSTVAALQVFAELAPGIPAPAGLAVSSKADGSGAVTLARNPAYGTFLFGDLKAAFAALPPVTGALSLYLTDHTIGDLWLAITWAGHE